MKTLVIILIVLLLAENSFCQTPASPTKDYYLKKSKGQNTTGWILLGSGVGIALIGAKVQINHDKNLPPCNNSYLGC